MKKSLQNRRCKLDSHFSEDFHSALVTVVLLTYNHEKWLSRAFESILCQETDFEFDIHVLEDASSDGTQNICREFAQRYPDKIKLFLRDKNVGVSKNLHAGLYDVKAKYYAFLEGDDYWCDPSKLQLQVNVLEANPDCSMCGHDTLIKDLQTGEEWAWMKKMMNVEPKGRTKFKLETNPFWTHPSSRMYRNIVDIAKLKPVMVMDTIALYVYQTVGDCYYIDKVMSVYNLTGLGAWTGIGRIQRKMGSLQGSYVKNKYCNFKYDAHLGPYSRLRKGLVLLLGKRLGWFFFYHTRMVGYRLQLIKEKFVRGE